MKHKQIFQEIITTAQGELALEQFLNESQNHWNVLTLDMVDYQGRCQLVRGWDLLFARLNEDINSLAHMKRSPFYKVEIDTSFLFLTDVGFC